MSLAPNLDPPAPMLTFLDQVGLVKIDPSEVYNCQRWATPDRRGGILYASHLPIPWGVYWVGERRVAQIAWSCSLDTALRILDLAVNN